MGEQLLFDRKFRMGELPSIQLLSVGCINYLIAVHEMPMVIHSRQFSWTYFASYGCC